METSNRIIESGGWVTSHTIGQPRARFFGMLSAIWLGVALLASGPFWGAWPDLFGLLEWLGVALIAPLPVFLGLAGFYFLTERPRAITEQRRNPDKDIRKLF